MLSCFGSWNYCVWHSECWACSNESKSLTRFFYELLSIILQRFCMQKNETLFLVISCVFLRSKYVPVNFLHSESYVGCIRQSYTVFLSSWKCVFGVNVIMFGAVEIIVFDIVNVGLVQKNRNHLHVSLMNSWVSYFNGFVCRKTKFLFLWTRVCYNAISLFL
jgi:hypothetical protein